jgi:hypothetical protein
MDVVPIHKRKFEYAMHHRGFPSLVWLNMEGENGWELVAIWGDYQIFKREVTHEPETVPARRQDILVP